MNIGRAREEQDGSMFGQVWSSRTISAFDAWAEWIDMVARSGIGMEEGGQILELVVVGRYVGQLSMPFVRRTVTRS